MSISYFLQTDVSLVACLLFMYTYLSENNTLSLFL